MFPKTSYDHMAHTGRPVAWGPAARLYHEYNTHGTEWDQVWIEILSDPHSYERPVLEADVRSILQSTINNIATGAVGIGPAVEAAQAQLNAILSAR